MKEYRESDHKLVSDINEYGWQVVLVGEGEQGPRFGYSVGLFHTFQHPEILIMSLKLDLILVLINNLGEEIKQGKHYQADHLYDDIIDKYDCAMVSVDYYYYSDYVGRAQWYYQGDDFPVLQCVFPNKEGFFPWSAGCPQAFKEAQPVLKK